MPFSQKTFSMASTTTNTTSQLESPSTIQSSPSSSQFQSQNDIVVNEIDVFICHAGKESKEGIGKLLYDELTKQSSLLKIILDMEIERGFQLDKFTYLASSLSKTMLVLISNELFDFNRSIDPLEEIYFAFDLKKTIIIPLFYELNPEQMKTKIESIQNNVENNNNNTNHTRYIEILNRLMNCAGVVRSLFKTENEFISTVVKYIFQILPHQTIINAGPRHIQFLAQSLGEKWEDVCMACDIKPNLIVDTIAGGNLISTQKKAIEFINHLISIKFQVNEFEKALKRANQHVLIPFLKPFISPQIVNNPMSMIQSNANNTIKKGDSKFIFDQQLKPNITALTNKK